MSPTGLKSATDVYIGRHHIICLDKWQRLPFNFAVNANGKYHEFRTLASARKFVRSL